MENKYRTSSCRAKNAVDPTIGCRCGVRCDQPIPTKAEIMALQTDLPAFQRWLRDTMGKEKVRSRKEIGRAQRENERATRLKVYFELSSKIEDDETLSIINEILLAV